MTLVWPWYVERPIPGTPLAPTVFLPMNPCVEEPSLITFATLQLIKAAAGSMVAWCGCPMCNPSRLLYPMTRKRRLTRDP